MVFRSVAPSFITHCEHPTKTPETFKLSLPTKLVTIMKSFYRLAVSIFFANNVIQMAAGLQCNSGCAACWLDNNNDGVDTKFTCTGGDCGDVCPTGYNGIHCARLERCLCAPGLELSCRVFGPCQCGSYTLPSGYLSCKSLDAC
ncbi:hypothetical protein K443DRAFT_677788 [Laccaria amethystina LaAM-08-1]|uniref:Uncharacterized protein n=1 Tax=Laccaria amethystina LaAM-08-1 TaxID=1095629 RepID=A0A0C9XX85_9AGAR|nr:hypothetical protein K443DRAFT_677788 [Laccaria amethystina LaAM-08-1]